MTAAEFQRFLDVAALVCAAMALLNLLRLRKRGTSALVLSGAFLAFGSTILVYGRQGVTPLTIGGGVLVLLLLIGDFVLRSGDHARKTDGKP